LRTAELRSPITPPSGQLGIADKLAFLACYSRYYLSVSAENYHHLAQLLVHELEGVAPLAVLHSDDIRKFEPALLVANGLGLREANSGSGSALEVISRLAETSAVRPLVIIDGIDKVSDDKLRQLLVLVERIGLGLALFGAQPINRRKACVQFENRIFHTDVARLSESDVRHLVRRRTSVEARMSDHDIEDLVQRSNGQIDRLDGLLDELTESPGRSLGLPLVHMSGLVVLVIVLIGGWLSIDHQQSTEVPIALELPDVSAAAKAPERSNLTGLAATTSKPDRTETQGDVAITNSPVAQTSEKVTQTTSSLAAAQSSQPERLSALLPQPQPQPQPRSERPLKAEAAEDLSSLAETPTRAPGASAPTPIDSIDPNAWVNELPAPAAGPEAQNSWLQSAPDTAYTLQLMGSHSESRILAFIAEQGSSHEFGYFKTTHRNQPWFVLTVGQYSDRDRALLAIDTLPGQLRAQKPWARSVASIRDQ
jgi:DamX protein